MQLNKLDNIVFLKDLESNIIEEAFIVLKDNVNFTKMEKEKYKKMTKKRHEFDIFCGILIYCRAENV